MLNFKFYTRAGKLVQIFSLTKIYFWIHANFVPSRARDRKKKALMQIGRK